MTDKPWNHFDLSQIRHMKLAEEDKSMENQSVNAPDACTLPSAQRQLVDGDSILRRALKQCSPASKSTLEICSSGICAKPTGIGTGRITVTF